MIKVSIKNNQFTVIDDCESTPGQSNQIILMKEQLKEVHNVLDLKKLPNFVFQCIIADGDSEIAYFKFKD
jgi:hypothetical protein